MTLEATETPAPATIHVGRFRIARVADVVWLCRDEGEGMELTPEQLQKVWEENY